MTSEKTDLTTEELADEYGLNLDRLHALRSDEQVLRMVAEGVCYLYEMETLASVAKPTLRDRANEHADAGRFDKIKDGRTYRYELAEGIDVESWSDGDGGEQVTAEESDEEPDPAPSDTLELADEESEEPEDICGAETASGDPCEWSPGDQCPHHGDSDEDDEEPADESEPELDDEIPDWLDTEYPGDWDVAGFSEDPAVVRWERGDDASIIVSGQAEDAHASIVHHPEGGDGEVYTVDEDGEIAPKVFELMESDLGTDGTEPSATGRFEGFDEPFNHAVESTTELRAAEPEESGDDRTFTMLDFSSELESPELESPELDEPEVDVDEFDSTADPSTEPAGDMHVSAGGDDRDGMMPVDRVIDWESYIPEEPETEYRQVDGEYDRIRSQINKRHETGFIPHIAMTAPSGSAKTALAKQLAYEDDAPLFTIQCSEGMLMQDIIGGATAVGDETHWVDGTGPKALMGSMDADEFEEKYGEPGYDGTVYLLIDEVNRTTSKTKSAILSLLDHRAQLILDARGGERIEGDPMEMVVISTMNEGPGYDVNSIDTAEKRRLGYKESIKWLGYDKNGHEGDPVAEMELLTEASPASLPLAKRLVECANELRELAEDRDRAVSYGPTTANLIDWAKVSFGFPESEDEPVVRAFEGIVKNWHLNGDDDEEARAEQVVSNHLAGCPVGEQAVKEWAGEAITEGETVVECYDCGFFEDADETEPKTLALMRCPECEGDLDSYED